MDDTGDDYSGGRRMQADMPPWSVVWEATAGESWQPWSGPGDDPLGAPELTTALDAATAAVLSQARKEGHLDVASPGMVEEYRTVELPGGELAKVRVTKVHGTHDLMAEVRVWRDPPSPATLLRQAVFRGKATQFPE